MTLPRTAADVLSGHVLFEIESIDRMYLNVYQPRLQYGGGVAAFFSGHRGHIYASSALMDPMTKAFVADIHHFVEAQGLDLVHFGKGEDKDDVTQRYLAAIPRHRGGPVRGPGPGEGTGVPHPEAPQPRNRADRTLAGATTRMVNHFYFYGVDEDFGPFFIKFCTYFPYNAKLCINGHEWAKRQVAKEGIGFEALDNGFAAVMTRRRCKRSATASRPRSIEALLRKWLRTCRTRSPRTTRRRLPLRPIDPPGRVLPDPGAGPAVDRSDVLRGGDPRESGHRPARQGHLIFDRRVTRPQRTPGRFRTRVITDGVTPSLHVDYKRSRSSNTTRRAAPCAPRPPSTIPATSASANGCLTCPPCGGSASPPTDVSSTSNASATTPPTATPPSLPSPTRSSPRLGRARRPALHRRPRAGPASALVRLPSAAQRLHQPRPPRPPGAAPGGYHRRHHPRPDDLRPATATTARPDRAPAHTHRYRVTETGYAAPCSSPACTPGCCARARPSSPASPRPSPRHCAPPTAPTATRSTTSPAGQD